MASFTAKFKTVAHRFFVARVTHRWSISLAATAISTYALDAVATMSGVLLVATGALDGLDQMMGLLFLTSTYAIWGTGLGVNIQANWKLLEQTGTSTSILSKAAYELTKTRGTSVRNRKIAAGFGYAIVELVKESPYYAGAFGAALLSDDVSASEAVIFLGGANLGAAGYEYGLACATRAILRRTVAQGYASFEQDWIPKEYLASYYRLVEADERHTIAFFVDAVATSLPDRPVLVFGCGPTLHHVFLVACKASEIHLGDFLPSNLCEVERWISNEGESHDWKPFVRFTLECEGIAAPTEIEILQREEVTRDKITKLLEVDVRNTSPLGDAIHPMYGTVISAYCADSATEDHELWETYMRRIVELVQPGGTLITAALCGTDSYLIGKKSFPSPNVDERDFRDLLAPYFECENVSIKVCAVPECQPQGYSRIILARANHRRAAQ